MSDLQERIEKLKDYLLVSMTRGIWEVWSGCSWRRIGVMGTQVTAVEPTVDSDGHPNLISSRNLEGICYLHNNTLPIIDELRESYHEAAYSADWGEAHWEESEREVEQLREDKRQALAALSDAKAISSLLARAENAIHKKSQQLHQERTEKWLPLLEAYEGDHEALHTFSELPKTMDGVGCSHCAIIAKAKEVQGE